MKRISRAILRGRPLDPACKIAHTTTGEYGPEDNRVFCYGLYDASTEEVEDLCRNCKAFVFNAEPLAVKENKE